MKNLIYIILTFIVGCTSGGTPKDRLNDSNLIDTIEQHNLGMDCILAKLHDNNAKKIDSAELTAIMRECIGSLFTDLDDSIAMEEFNDILEMAMAEMRESEKHRDEFPIMIDSIDIAHYPKNDFIFFMNMKKDINSKQNLEEIIVAIDKYLYQVTHEDIGLSKRAKEDILFILNFTKEDIQYHNDLQEYRKDFLDSVRRKVDKWH